MKRILAGLASIAVILFLVVGIPWALVVLAGNPLPTLDELSSWLTLPDWGGTFLLGALIPCAAWVAWGVFIIPFLTSFPEVLRSARMSTFGTGRIVVAASGPFKLQRRTAGLLLGAVIVMFGGGQAAMATPMESVAAPVGIVQTVDRVSVPGASTESEPVALPAAEVEVITPAMESVTVEPGDSLWKIAEQELGDGNRYGELFEASKDVLQPDGGYLQDPNMIHPGWNLNVPDSVVPVPAPAEEVVEEVVEESAAVAESDASAADDAISSEVTPDAVETEQSSPEGTEDASSAVAAEADRGSDAETSETSPETLLADSTPAVDEPSANEAGAIPEPSSVTAGAAGQETVPTAAATPTDTAEGDLAPAALAAGGIAGLLGAALMGVLRVRRARQRRSRRRHENIAMPEPEAALVEAQLREVQEPLEMADVDRVCRFLTEWSRESEERLPELLAVRLAPEERQISVFLMAPAALPSPFVEVSEDHTAWQIRDADMDSLAGSYEAGAYPALVTLGKDQAGGHVLIDLEQWGDIAITGEADLAVAAATAAVLELAHVSWADETLIHLVGESIVIPESLRNGRCEQHPDLASLIDHIRHRAVNVRASLEASEHTSIGRARATDEGESWTPEIIVVSDPTAPELAELKALAAERPRLGIISLAVGGTGSAELKINSESEAVFSPAGLSYAPQLVTPETLEQLDAVFAVTDSPAEVEVESDLAESVEVAAIAGGTDESPDRHVELVDEIPQPVTVETDEVVVDDHEEETTEAVEDETATNAPEPAVVVLPPRDPNAPYVRVLGTVEIEPGEGRELGAPPIGRSPELVAFLALHPHATSTEYARAFWPNKTMQTASASMRKLSNVTRNWLGDTPEGEHYLPRYDASHGYRVHDAVRSDWGDFKMLVGSDPINAATENLVEALKLVRDQPFTGVRDRFFTWAELDKERMIGAIADAADELYSRAHDARDAVKARYAATLGKRVSPESELAWRNSLRVALSQGDSEEFERLVNELIDYLDELGDDYDPDVETRALIEEGRTALAGV